MKIKYLFLFLFLFVFSQNTVYSQSYAQDTVWTKVTDQSQGFWKVKFSNNDSIIVGHGYENAIFYYSLTGDEIIRLPFNAEVHFFNNDSKYVQLAPSLNKLNIYDTKTHLLIGEIQNDSLLIGNYQISKDEKYIFGVVTNGIRLWNLETKSIVLTKFFNTETGQKLIEVYDVKILNDNSKALLTIYKEYDKNNQTEVRRYYPVYNLMTLDSIDTWEFFGKGATRYQLSKTNKYFAIKTGDPTYGVEIYDFNTKQLLHRLPINGPSLTGIEFSPDDKYIVTSNGPGANSLIIWDVMTGNQTHRYWPSSHSNIDISHNGKYIISNVGNSYLRLFFARFGGTPVPIIPNVSTILYPNPTTGLVNIDNIVTEKITIYISNGALQGTITPINSNNGISFNVSNLPNGEYLIRIEGKENTTYKLIIIK